VRGRPVMLSNTDMPEPCRKSRVGHGPARSDRREETAVTTLVPVPHSRTPTSPVFRSKLRPPNVERLVRRPRLLDQLAEATSRPITLVVAPAGTGKSSLLANWAAESERPGAWFTVDDTDHDTAQFWTGIVAALEGLVETTLSEPLRLIQRPGSIEVGVAALLESLELQDRPSSTLFLDDVHVIDSDPQAVSLLSTFVQHLPRWLHVVLLSRRAPTLPLARLRARGELGEVGLTDLLFLDDEAAELFRALAPGLDADQVDTEVARTDGWAAGIRLAALAARSSRGRPPPDSIEAQDLLISEYVWKEVLADESPDVVGVLVDVSVVERVNSALAAHLTEQADAGKIMDAAESRGLFVTRLGATDWFTIHPVVRDALRSQLTRHSPTRLLDLHGRAAQWFAAAGEVAIAFDHFISGDRPADALRLLATNTTHLYDTGREATVSRALARLPADIARNDVEQAINLAWSHWLVDNEAFPALLEQACLLADRTHQDDRLIRARLTIMKSTAAITDGDWAGAHDLISLALDDFGESWQEDLLGRFCWNMIARTVALSETWENSDEISIAKREVSRNASRRLAFEGSRALGEALAGHPVDALRVAAGVRAAAAVANMTILRLEMTAAEAVAFRELGDRAEAADRLDDLVATRHGPLTYIAALARLELTQMRLDEGRFSQAETEFGRAVTLVEARMPGSGARNWLARTGTRLALAKGEPDLARHWADGIVDPFWGPVSRARVQWAVDDRVGGLESLDSAVPRNIRHGVLRDLLRAQLLPRHDDAVALAGEAARRAAGGGLVQTVASEGAGCIRLVELSAWQVPEAWLSRVRRAHMGVGVEQANPRGFQALTEREVEVLRLLPSRLTLGEIAGELFISMNTLKFHLKVIYRKLGCNSRAEAAAHAEELARPRPADRGPVRARG
jgi:LuxR family maltose regulon positive regulatory protein